ncbi:MAG: hypothetical protein K2G56_06390, partial [Eubacterium sp.]|nr:hypothetical protein [Eubacterium sp.]
LDKSKFSVLTTVYPEGYTMGAAAPTSANPKAQAVIAILSIGINVCVLTAIIMRSKNQKKNPYTNEIFTDQKDYKLALQRAAEANKIA